MGDKKKAKRRRKTWLLGVGLDNDDGHTRVTKGENFALFGGSEKTHCQMQEKAIKMNEHLKRRGKTLENVSRQEFLDIADKIAMQVTLPKERKALPPATSNEHEP